MVLRIELGEITEETVQKIIEDIEASKCADGYVTIKASCITAISTVEEREVL